MKDLSWDDTIAKGAQEYADECNGMVHSKSSYGENLAGASYNDVTKLFELWMGEKKDFDESGYRAKFLSSSYNGKAIGHYSQIVWAANSKLGCGYAYCSNISLSYLLVCRYETGNYINQQVYAGPTSTSTIDDPNLKNEDTTTKDSPTNKDEDKDSAESIYKLSFKMILFSIFLTIYILI
ncbi:PR-1-like protein [Neocallimastix sp. 'constans']